ncbi:hypothetical protein QMG83_14475 [Salinibacterium sp. G-O1]|uniref:hypothetical protein n=1 Tax=Salinibacterium sp. G-O1 TaxID=3046208 RepID=UPI0024BB5198|nr:hypothetical protein [Salinibacterium sp. G-O1]MDJ0336429.1 hypothetical protein [Salinibacterium sp. G-O1]
MNDHELARVVARIQAGDNRTVDRVTMSHWKEIIGHLPVTDAMTAIVMHFRESTAYLTPAHIVANARRLSEQRALEAPPIDDAPIGSGWPKPANYEAMSAAYNDPAEFQHQCAIYNRQLADAGYEINHRYPIAPAQEAA